MPEKYSRDRGGESSRTCEDRYRRDRECSLGNSVEVAICLAIRGQYRAIPEAGRDSCGTSADRC